VKGYNGVTSFFSGYGNVWLVCLLPAGKTEMIILQEVVHLAGSSNFTSLSRIMNKDIEVKPVNHYGLNLYNHDGNLIATAPQVDGLFDLDQAWE
jgi:hypothetical protein